MKYSILILFASALLLRLISLNQSLWMDEATTARVVQNYGFSQIISEFSRNDFHPPLYYLLMKLWTNVFGYSEISLRMPSLLFSMLTGYLVFKIAKLLNGYIVGMWAAVFFLFNPLIIYYSQEARMYMTATFFLTLALWSFWGALATPESNNDSGRARSSLARMTNRSRSKFGMTKTIILFNLFIVLALLTFYGSVFLIIPMLLYLFIRKEYMYFYVSCFMLCVTLFFLFPLLYRQLINARSQIALVVNWTQVLGQASLKNLLLIPIKFSIGRISLNPKWLYWSISTIWTVFIWFLVGKGGFKNRLLFFLLIAPLGFGFLFSFYSPLLQYFRFLYLIPILSILLAIGSARFHLRGGNWLAAAGLIIFSLVYLFNSKFHREDWKNLVRNLNKDKVYMIYSSSDPVNYYRKDLKIIDLKTVENMKITDPEIIVIPYSADIHRIDYQKILKLKKYELIKNEVFRDVSVETWKYFKQKFF